VVVVVLFKRFEVCVVGVLVVGLFFSSVANAKGKTKAEPEEAKALSGISIVGNKEAPKSLFIVPWKSSELAVETGLSSKLLNEKLEPVDKEVFERELEFFYATTTP